MDPQSGSVAAELIESMLERGHAGHVDSGTVALKVVTDRSIAAGVGIWAIAFDGAMGPVEAQLSP